MQEKEIHNISKYVFWIIIAAMLIISYFVIKPFIIPILSAFVLAYLSKPLFFYLTPKLGKNLSAFICIFLIIIIVILPIAAIIGGVINQTTEILDSNTLNSLFQSALTHPLIQKLNIDISELIEKSLSFLISKLTSYISLLPSLLLNTFITLFGIYYILISWNELSENLEKYLPFKDKKQVKKEISQITNTIVYGTILIALIEFIIALNGFFISGVGPYLLFPLIIFFLAFIPGLGPTIVWLPLAIYHLIIGNYPTFIGVTITGLILSIPIDTIFRAKLLGDKVKLNPLIMLVGILGGIALFGIFGFIIGPLILIYTIELIEKALMKS